MKVVHVSTWDHGGAAKACIRLHEALLGEGVDSALLTLSVASGRVEAQFQYREEVPPPGALRRLWKKLSGAANREARQKLLRKKERKKLVETVRQHFEYFSFPDSDYKRIGEHSLIKEADVINLHWVSDWLDFPTFWPAVRGKKVVWTLHDMNAFTGGCHYSAGCSGYRDACRACPQIRDTDLPDQAEGALALKMAALGKAAGPQCIVTPSRWLGACSSSSRLFGGLPHHVIPYSLPTHTFKPLPMEACRKVLGLPEHKKVLLFVSSKIGNLRKGFDLLLESLTLLPVTDDLVLCCAGEMENWIGIPGVEYVPLGVIQDEKLMSIVYNAADAFILPAREDNLPNVVLESLACGTPVIGFAVGGISDMLQAGDNGLLAQQTTAAALAAQLAGFLNGDYSFVRSRIAEGAWTRYSPRVQAEAYQALYKTLLTQ